MNIITRKLSGITWKKLHQNKNHYKVPMSCAFILRKGEIANVHSGGLTICSFAVVKVRNKNTKELLGNLFIHQGCEPLNFTLDKDWVTELSHIRTAPDTTFVNDSGPGNTLNMLNSLLIKHGITGNVQQLAKPGKGNFYHTSGTFDVNDKGEATEVEPSTNVFGAQTKSEGDCTIL